MLTAFYFTGVVSVTKFLRRLFAAIQVLLLVFSASLIEPTGAAELLSPAAVSDADAVDPKESASHVNRKQGSAAPAESKSGRAPSPVGSVSRKSAAPGSHFSPHDDSFVSHYLRADEYIPVSEIKPGMEGYGLSVFQGTKIEKFQVKVIGVIKQVLNGRDAILIRLSGAVLGKNNVVKGMSGSPIYLNGRLAGALSYGFDFSKEPIVGVTPVVDMLDALTFDDPDKKKHVSHNFRSRTVPLPAVAFPAPSSLPVPSSGGLLHMSPLMAPVSLAGFSHRAQDYLKDKFKDVGLSVSGGAAGGMDHSLAHSDSQRIAPGGAVALMLTTGDFASAATGTATCQFGNKIVAFGHSFMDAGQVAFPMATAYIHEVLPSLSVSFKLSSPIQEVGTVFADRPWSIGGEVGRFCEMIPLTINVTDESRHVKKVYNCKLVDDPELTPSLVTATIMSALDSTYQSQDPHVIKVNTDIELRDHRKVSRNDRFAVNFPAHVTGDSHLKISSDPVSGYVGGLVDKIVDNDYERAQLSRLKVDVVVEDGRKVSRIERIYLDRATVAPGESVVVNCVLRPFAQEPVVEKLAFAVPRDLPDGDLAIGVSGGDEFENIRKRMGIIDPQPETLKQIINRMTRKERGDTLCGVMALPSQSIALDGEVLKNPPAQWVKLFFSDRSTRVPTLVRGEERARMLSDNLIDGSHIIGFTVKRHDKVYARALPYSVSPAQVAHPSDGVYITEQAKKAIESGRKTEAAAGTASATPAAAATTSTNEKSIVSWSQAQSYPHMRAVGLWRQDSEEAFRGGHCEGVAVDSVGRLNPGYRELNRQGLDCQHIWGGLPIQNHNNNGSRADGFYFSADNKIMVYRGGTPELIAKLPGLLVSALAADSKGNLYAAAAPGGEIYKIEDKLARPVCKVSESIVSALAFDSRDCLYIGTCGSGRVYTLAAGKSDAGLNADLLCDTNQAHITALNYNEREHKLYIGTAEKGCVYSIDSGSKLKAEFESGEHIVTGVARDNAGNLFISTAGSGKLFRVYANGQSDVVATSEAFYTMFYDSREDRVYCGDAEGDITRVEIDQATDQARFIPVCHTEQEAVNALGVLDGKLYCGTSNNAQVRSFALIANGEPVYSSAVHDAARPAVWSRLRFYDVLNQENVSLYRAIRVESRSGESSQPDQSWSPWTAALSDHEGFVLKSPAARYLQYRLTWKLPEKLVRDTDLIVSRVDVTFQASNQTPTISSLSLKNGDALNDTVQMAITGADQDADNLSLAIDLSDDSGKSWKAVVSDFRSRPDKDDKLKKKAKEEAKAEAKSDSKVDSKTDSKTDSKSTAKEGTKSEDSSKSKADDKIQSVHPKDESTEKSAPKMAPSSGTGSRPPQDKSPVDDRESSKAKEPRSGEFDKDKDSDKNKAKAADGKAESKADPKGEAKKDDKSEKSDKSKAESEAKVAEQYSQSEKFTYPLETKKIKDGTYLVRIRLSDLPSNAAQSLVATAYRTVLIDNTPPKVTLKVDSSKKGKLSLLLSVQDEVSGVADAIYKIEGQEAYAFGPSKDVGQINIADSHSAALVAEDIALPAGVSGKKVTIQVYDRAGNCSKKSINLP